MTTNIRSLPWIDWDEWLYAKNGLFSLDIYEKGKALEIIIMWRARGKIPHAVDSTACLVEIIAKDCPPHDIMFQTSRSEAELRLMYSLAIIRTVNGLVDPFQQNYFANSIFNLATKIGLPGWIVEIRHDATHNNLPSLPTLRTAADFLVSWLYNNYWLVQEEHLKSLSLQSLPVPLNELQLKRRRKKMSNKYPMESIIDESDHSSLLDKPKLSILVDVFIPLFLTSTILSDMVTTTDTTTLQDEAQVISSSSVSNIVSIPKNQAHDLPVDIQQQRQIFHSHLTYWSSTIKHIIKHSFYETLLSHIIVCLFDSLEKFDQSECPADVIDWRMTNGLLWIKYILQYHKKYQHKLQAAQPDLSSYLNTTARSQDNKCNSKNLLHNNLSCLLSLRIRLYSLSELSQQKMNAIQKMMSPWWGDDHHHRYPPPLHPTSHSSQDRSTKVYMDSDSDSNNDKDTAESLINSFSSSSNSDQMSCSTSESDNDYDDNAHDNSVHDDRSCKKKGEDTTTSSIGSEIEQVNDQVELVKTIAESIPTGSNESRKGVGIGVVDRQNTDLVNKLLSSTSTSTNVLEKKSKLYSLEVEELDVDQVHDTIYDKNNIHSNITDTDVVKKPNRISNIDSGQSVSLQNTERDIDQSVEEILSRNRKRRRRSSDKKLSCKFINVTKAEHQQGSVEHDSTSTSSSVKDCSNSKSMNELQNVGTMTGESFVTWPIGCRPGYLQSSYLYLIEQIT